jgi:hypothetical protein
MRQPLLLISLLLCVGCATVDPPADVAIESAGLTSVDQMIAAATAAGNAAAANKSAAAMMTFNNMAAADAARVAVLPRAAKRLRERQILEVLSVVADTPEARAAAQIALKEKEEEEKNEKKLEDLLGGGLGLGLTVTYNVADDRVATAVLVGETGKEVVRVTKDENIAARLLLEGHYLFTTNPFNQKVKDRNNNTFDVSDAQRTNCALDAARSERLDRHINSVRRRISETTSTLR